MQAILARGLVDSNWFSWGARPTMSGRLLALDIVRGMAALLVCLGHIRSCVFVDWAEVTTPTIFDRFFYLGTGLGGQAVMIFFVLSGYLVGGNVLGSISSGKWSWLSYCSKRLVRLWVVLVPALVLTFLWDSAGEVFASSAYEGAFYSLLLSGPHPARSISEGITAFIGNMFFLQTITVPVYGSNSPLWSLANEFWYYLLFPLLLLAPQRGWLKGGLLGVSALAILVLLPTQIIMGGLIWLMGAAAWWLAHRAGVPKYFRRLPLAIIVSSLLFIASLSASRFDIWFGSNYAIGAATAALIYSLSVYGWTQTPSILRSVFEYVAPPWERLSEISYTLYLVHFPLVIFIWFTVLAPTQLQPDFTGAMIFTAILAAALIYSHAVWWFFERHTPFLQRIAIATLNKWTESAFGTIKS
jgi:peptidoglycan/LPS O-acetylase OafA/YrhL